MSYILRDEKYIGSYFNVLYKDNINGLNEFTKLTNEIEKYDSISRDNNSVKLGEGYLTINTSVNYKKKIKNYYQSYLQNHLLL